MAAETDEFEPLRGVEDVYGFIKRVCFKTGPPGAVGIESEWFVVDPTDPDRAVPIAQLQTALSGAALPYGSLITFEPGGQLELSSSVAPDLSSACRGLAVDLDVARRAISAAGLRLLGQGTDPRRPPRLQVRGPRYSAMRTFFAKGGSAGEAMMSSTAAVQVCLDAGRDAADVARRWRLAHSLLPVLLAAFANSPCRFGRPTGFRSSRYAIWSGIDPGRTAAPVGPDPVAAWARYALDAQVMLVRTPAEPWIADPGCTFEDWLCGRSELPRPTVQDLRYHLSTLFPPVRPRGWFELRYLDALPDGLWQVAVAVTTALLEDASVSDAVAETTEPVAGLTAVAMRDAVADQRLRRAAERCLELAGAALPRLSAGELVGPVESFRERYTSRSRCPADDLLEGLAPLDCPTSTAAVPAAGPLDPSPVS